MQLRKLCDRAAQIVIISTDKMMDDESPPLLAAAVTSVSLSAILTLFAVKVVLAGFQISHTRDGSDDAGLRLAAKLVELSSAALRLSEQPPPPVLEPVCTTSTLAQLLGATKEPQKPNTTSVVISYPLLTAATSAAAPPVVVHPPISQLGKQKLYTHIKAEKFDEYDNAPLSRPWQRWTPGSAVDDSIANRTTQLLALANRVLDLCCGELGCQLWLRNN